MKTKQEEILVRWGVLPKTCGVDGGEVYIEVEDFPSAVKALRIYFSGEGYVEKQVRIKRPGVTILHVTVYICLMGKLKMLTMETASNG